MLEVERCLFLLAAEDKLHDVAATRVGPCGCGAGAGRVVRFLERRVSRGIGGYGSWDD